MSNNPHFMNMTADTLGKSLLQGLIQEIRIMPDCWQKLPEAKQQDIIDRLERQVRNAATIAVHTIAGGDRDTVYGKLESMTAKDKMKAVFVVNPSSPHKEDLLFAVNKDCLLIIGGANEFTGGMDQVKPDPDQNPLDLNGGDHDMEDAGAWGGMQPADDSDVVDAEFQELPQLTVERFAGHTLGEIAIGVATKKDVFDAAWLQSRFAHHRGSRARHSPTAGPGRHRARAGERGVPRVEHLPRRQEAGGYRPRPGVSHAHHETRNHQLPRAASCGP